MNNSETSSLWKRFVDRPEVYKPFGIIIFLSLAQQFSSMSILRAYVVEIFDTLFTKNGTVQEIGPGDNITCSFDGADYGTTSNNAYISAIIIGTARLIGCVELICYEY